MYGNRKLEKELRDYTAITRCGVSVSGREIRSHRREPDYSDRRGLAIFVALGLMAAMLTTEITRSQVIVTEVPTPAAVEATSEQTPVNVGEPWRSETSFYNPREDVPKVAKEVERKPPSRIEIVIGYALAQRGDPYRWAASGPNAFDCSGLVLAAFRQVNVKLPHYTGTMIGHGVRVSRAGLQRGDIVFPESGHVGIYLSGGEYIHASSSRGGVAVTKLYSFYAARRITV